LERQENFTSVTTLAQLLQMLVSISTISKTIMGGTTGCRFTTIGYSWHIYYGYCQQSPFEAHGLPIVLPLEIQNQMKSCKRNMAFIFLQLCSEGKTIYLPSK